VLVHFPHDFPPVRWTRRLLRRVRGPRYDTRPSPGRETRSQR
jgi:hypothetical protein